jgi:ubiquitin-like 1-activating enzyme E1 B
VDSFGKTAKMDRYSSLRSVYGEATVAAIHTSHVLVVGAGGIGCEVLKNLVMSGKQVLTPSFPFLLPSSLPIFFIGFQKIDIIDLDTVDISNLNRQFLFRPEHVNSSKALVAAQSAKQFNPSVEINPFHQNIKEPQFNREFFLKYDLVLNALDNIDARRHVNRLCLAYDLPLIESGTTGYIGQAMPIIKKVTECYECLPKISQKVYPICTIRSTPSQPVHCIVWAKEFFKLLFGNRSESLLFEDESTEESTFMKYLDDSPLTGASASAAGASASPSGPSPPPTAVAVIAYAIPLLKAFYCTEIEKKKAMGIYKTSDRIPESLSLSVLSEAQEFVTNLFVSTKEASSSVPPLTRPSERKGWERATWSTLDCVVELLCCFVSLYCAEDSSQRSLLGSYVFDKDDRLAMIFVTAASVIRSQIFQIPNSSLSFHDTKGIAGNIIPAIASTNAIIAGLQVVEAIRYLSLKAKRQAEAKDSSSSSSGSNRTAAGAMGGLTAEMCRTTYCQRMPTRRGYYLQPTPSAEPNPNCYVCGTSQLIVEVPPSPLPPSPCLPFSLSLLSAALCCVIQVDTTEMTLERFVALVVKQRLGLVEPFLMLGSAMVYEEGEDSDVSLSGYVLSPLANCIGGGIRDGSIITLGDFRQDLTASHPLSLSPLLDCLLSLALLTVFRSCLALLCCSLCALSLVLSS